MQRTGLRGSSRGKNRAGAVTQDHLLKAFTLWRNVSLAAALMSLALLFGGASAHAQVRSATVAGTVTDSSGGAVAGAKVSVIETATGQHYDVTSNGTGEFTVPYLPGGLYTLKVEQTGFETASQENVRVGNGESVHLQVGLKIGAANETVTVSTAGGTIQVDSPVVQSVVSEEVIASIPNVAHNPLAYVALQAGVSTRGSQSTQNGTNSFGIGATARRQISAFAINGGQAFENDILLDGLSTQGSGWNEVTVLMNQDAIQETRALVNDYSAQYGRAHGVVVQTTKGGTNQFRGLLFMRDRTSILSSNSYANNAQGVAKPYLNILTYGGTLGGPIVHDKAFFFGSYEGLFYDNPRTFFRNVPTALERVGDFSQTKANVSGSAVPLNIYDPFNVTQTATNQYTRALIAGANTANSVNGTNALAVSIMKNYPLPNRTPDDAFGTNNWIGTGTQTFRKANINARVDYRLRSNDYLYVSGGYTNGTIKNPLIWNNGTLYNPADASSNDIRLISDRNPYINIGNTLVVSPTFVIDLRYGINRVAANATSDYLPSNFDFTTVGLDAASASQVPVNVLPSFTVTGGRFSPVNNDNNYNKLERQTNQVIAASATKTAGKWNYKFGGELRIFLANFTDSATSALYNINSNFTTKTVDASGNNSGSFTPDNGGEAYASFLLGTGSLGIPSGQTVKLALLHQYGGFYTQNDWHPNEKLTLNLGLRYDWQPAPEDRYGRISSIDLQGTNPYGGKGRIYFPGAKGNGRRMWDTDWTNFQPRLGFAYRVHADTVVRGGVGVSFLPANTGFFGGGYLFGTTSFATYTNSQPYGFGVQNGKPAGFFNSTAINQLVLGTGANESAPGLYGGVGGPRFPTHGYKNPYVYQGNLHVQQALSKTWSIDIGYNVEVGKRLALGSSFSPNSDQFLDPGLLQSWRADYIARNGAGNAGSDQVANPFQPNPASLIPFAGNLGKATMPRDQTLWAEPYLGNQVINQNRGFSTYHALQASVKHEYSRGFILGANFTWSKSLGVDGGLVQNNLSGEGTGNTLPYLADIRRDKRLSANDIPIRFASYAVYELPFGSGKDFSTGNRFVNALIGGFRVSGTYIWQSGPPNQVSGVAGGSLNGLPDRNPGVPLVLPKSFQHFYNGSQSVTLPVSGRVITPAKNTFLKFNPDAFVGRTVIVANGTRQTDAYWYGNASTNYAELRSNPLNNVQATLERDVKLHERYMLNFQINATNLLNHTQFLPNSYSTGLGSTQVTGSAIGYGNNASYGTHGLGTLDPRTVELQGKLRF